MIQGLAGEQRSSGAIVHGGLVQAGTDKRRLLSVMAVLAEVRDAPAMNRPWDGWLDPAARPARMTIGAALVDPSWRVEVTGVAALDGRGAWNA